MPQPISPAGCSSAVAPQEVDRDRVLTACEVVACHGRYFGLPELEAEQRADELLETFDLSAKTKPHRLSGRLRRRPLIAPHAGAPVLGERLEDAHVEAMR